MSCVVPPQVKVTNVRNPQSVCGIGRQDSAEIKAEPVEIFPKGFELWIGPVKFPPCKALALDHQLHGRSNSSSDDLDAFGVKVTTEPLKMSTQQHYVTTQVLVSEFGKGYKCKGGSTLVIHFSQTRHSFVLPAQQS